MAELPGRADQTGGLLGRFAPLIRSLPARAPLERGDLLVPGFRLHQDGALAVYYAPFDHVNERARVVVVGITPGWAQMEISFRQARTDLLGGRPLPEVAERAKYAASFAGSMRTNLVAMLDGIGVPGALGIESTAILFGAHRALLHPTSVVRYPVFVGGANYTGHKPRLLVHPLLRDYAFGPFAGELRRTGDALVVPLGRAVSEVLAALSDNGVLQAERCLLGFPHPSGANGHRLREYTATRDDMVRQVQAWSAVSRG